MWLPMVLDILCKQDNVHANINPSRIVKIVHGLAMNNRHIVSVQLYSMVSMVIHAF